MKRTLIVILTALFSHATFGGTVEDGPPITAAQLARHLDVFSYSLTYKQERPFTSFSYVLSYKERRPDGKYETRAELLSSTRNFATPETEVSLAIFLDTNHATIASGGWTTHGKGYDVGSIFSSGTPPKLRDGGGYVLLRTTIDSHVTDTEANTKGILELEIKSTE